MNYLIISFPFSFPFSLAPAKLAVGALHSLSLSLALRDYFIGADIED